MNGINTKKYILFKAKSRMPLLLKRQELEDWIMVDAAVEFILAKKPILWNRTAEYEQLKLFS